MIALWYYSGSRIWYCGRNFTDFCRAYTFYAVCWKECGGSSGCLCQIPQMYGIFLLESWYSQCRPYGNSRTWIFRQSRFLRRNRNDRQNSCLSWICRNFWLHSHLLRRPDCLDHSNLLYFSDMPVVHPKVYKNACIYSSSSK